MSNFLYTKIILSEMRALLKPLGYRKRGQLFEKVGEEVVHFIGFQKSLSSSKDAIKVTVNLSIWLNALAPIRAGKPDTPSIWDAHWRMRIGSLMPEKEDKWWMVNTEVEANQATKEICTALTEYALPEFKMIQSQDDVINLWRNGIAPGLTDFTRTEYLKKIDGLPKQST